MAIKQEQLVRMTVIIFDFIVFIAINGDDETNYSYRYPLDTVKSVCVRWKIEGDKAVCCPVRWIITPSLTYLWTLYRL